MADVADSESGDSHSSDVTLFEGGLASGRRLAADLAAGLGLPFIAGFWVTMKTTSCGWDYVCVKYYAHPNFNCSLSRGSDYLREWSLKAPRFRWCQ